MRKQYAVFGLGKFGESVALALESLHCEVVVVDNNAEKIHEIADSVSYAMHANIEDPEVIKTLGARNLDGVVVAIAENMEASIMATILSKEAGVPYVLAKAQSSIHGDILKKVGADAIVYPEKEIGARIAKRLVSSDFTDWINLSPDYSITEVGVPDEWKKRSLTELKLRELYNVNVVGLIRAGKVEINVDPDQHLETDDILILIGSNDNLRRILKNRGK